MRIKKTEFELEEVGISPQRFFDLCIEESKTERVALNDDSLDYELFSEGDGYGIERRAYPDGIVELYLNDPMHSLYKMSEPNGRHLIEIEMTYDKSSRTGYFSYYEAIRED